MLEEAAASQGQGPGVGGLTMDAELAMVGDLDPFGDVDVMMDMDVHRGGTPVDADGNGERRRAGTSVPRRVTSDSMQSGSSADGSNSNDGSSSSNTQAGLHDSSNSSSRESPRMNQLRHAQRRDGGLGPNLAIHSDDGSGGDVSDVDSMHGVRSGHGYGRGRMGGGGPGRICEGGVEGDGGELDDGASDMEVLRDETGKALDRDAILQALLNF